MNSYQAFLLAELSQFFIKNDFTFSLEKIPFFKEVKEGNISIFPTAKEYEGMVLIELVLGIRIHQVESLTAPFNTSLQINKAEALTLSVPFGELEEKKYFRYQATNEKELKEVIQKIEDFMQAKGFTFLEKYSILENLNQLINQDTFPNPYIPNIFHQSLKGTAILWLLKDNSWKVYAEKYLAKMQAFALPEKQIKLFENFYDFLAK